MPFIISALRELQNDLRALAQDRPVEAVVEAKEPTPGRRAHDQFLPFLVELIDHIANVLSCNFSATLTLAVVKLEQFMESNPIKDTYYQVHDRRSEKIFNCLSKFLQKLANNSPQVVTEVEGFRQRFWLFKKILNKLKLTELQQLGEEYISAASKNLATSELKSDPAADLSLWFKKYGHLYSEWLRTFIAVFIPAKPMPMDVFTPFRHLIKGFLRSSGKPLLGRVVGESLQQLSAVILSQPEQQSLRLRFDALADALAKMPVEPAAIEVAYNQVLDGIFESKESGTARTQLDKFIKICIQKAQTRDAAAELLHMDPPVVLLREPEFHEINLLFLSLLKKPSAQQKAKIMAQLQQATAACPGYAEFVRSVQELVGLILHGDEARMLRLAVQELIYLDLTQIQNTPQAAKEEKRDSVDLDVRHKVALREGHPKATPTATQREKVVPAEGKEIKEAPLQQRDLLKAAANKALGVFFVTISKDVGYEKIQEIFAWILKELLGFLDASLEGTVQNFYLRWREAEWNKLDKLMLEQQEWKREEKHDASREVKQEAGREEKHDAGREEKHDAGREEKHDAGREEKHDASREVKQEASREVKQEVGREEKHEVNPESTPLMVVNEQIKRLQEEIQRLEGLSIQQASLKSSVEKYTIENERYQPIRASVLERHAKAAQWIQASIQLKQALLQKAKDEAHRLLVGNLDVAEEKVNEVVQKLNLRESSRLRFKYYRSIARPATAEQSKRPAVDTIQLKEEHQAAVQTFKAAIQQQLGQLILSIPAINKEMSEIALAMDKSCAELQTQDQNRDSLSTQVQYTRHFLFCYTKKLEKCQALLLDLENKLKRLEARTLAYVDRTDALALDLSRAIKTILNCKHNLTPSLELEVKGEQPPPAQLNYLFWKRNNLETQVQSKQREHFVRTVESKINHFLEASRAAQRNLGFFAAFSSRFFSCLGYRAEADPWPGYVTEVLLPAIKNYGQTGMRAPFIEVLKDGLSRFRFRMQGCADPEALHTFLFELRNQFLPPPRVQLPRAGVQ